MCHIYLASLNFVELADLSKIHMASFLIAAMIHDFKHPGLNNGYLMNTDDKIALTYNDVSVLENYHIAQAFKAIQRP